MALTFKTLAKDLGSSGGSQPKSPMVLPSAPNVGVATSPFGQGPAAQQDASDKATRNANNPWYVASEGDQ